MFSYIEKMSKGSCVKYSKNIKKTKKSKKWEYGDERYENLSETEKQMLVEYRKKILRNGKNKQRLIEFSWYYQKNNYNLFICLNRQKNLFLEIFDQPSWFFKRIGIFFLGGGGWGRMEWQRFS